MLTLRFETEKDKLATIYASLGICGEVVGANFIFLDDAETDVKLQEKSENAAQENAVGLWRMRIDGNVGEIDKISFHESVDIEDRNFFVRAMLYKLQLLGSMKIRVCGEHKELQLFGFQCVDGNMEIETQNINLHLCGIG